MYFLFLGRYNGTDGILSDIGSTITEKFGIETSEVVRTRQFLMNSLDGICKMSPACGETASAIKWLHIDHSRGGAVDLRAIEGMSAQQKEALQMHLLVTSIAPAEPIPKRYALSAVNF